MVGMIGGVAVNLGAQSLKPALTKRLNFVPTPSAVPVKNMLCSMEQVTRELEEEKQTN